MLFKCSWFYESLQQQTGTTASSNVGWTETWYGDFPQIEQALAAMRSTAVGSYLQLRLRFMPATYRVAWLRASQLDRPNNSKLAGPPALVVGNAPRLDLGDASPAAQVNCCVYVDFWAPPRNATDKAHHRRFLIRGLPLGMINGNILVESSVHFSALLDFCNYIGQVRAPRPPGQDPANNGPWQMKVQENVPPAQGMTSLIIDPDSNERGIVVTSPGLAAAYGQKFIVKGVRFPSFVSRTWTSAVTVAAGGGIVMKQGRKRLAGLWDHSGQIQSVVNALIFPTQYTVIGLRNKKIGPPSKPTRGRRRAA